MDGLRIGVIGFGYIGRLHARAWENIPGVRVTAVADAGGVVLSSGIHPIDGLRWFTEDEIVAVAGAASNRYFAAPVEDAAQLLARFRSGITAEMTFAFSSQPRPLVCDLEVIGTAGQL